MLLQVNVEVSSLHSSLSFVRGAYQEHQGVVAALQGELDQTLAPLRVDKNKNNNNRQSRQEPIVYEIKCVYCYCEKRE